LIYLYRNVENKSKGENRFVYLLFIYFLSAFLVFFSFPFCPCNKKVENKITSPTILKTDSTLEMVNDSLIINDTTPKKDKKEQLKPTVKDTGKIVQKEIIVTGPSPVQSVFSTYNQFGGKYVSLDEGKKIVCLFVPGCDHCKDAAKQIVQLSKKHQLPPVYILFMNEETFKIPDFIKETNANYPYYVIDDIPTFFQLLGNNASTPGVSYLWNGNTIKSYQGTGDQKFNPDDMIKAIESNLK
jgi:hypothetical protein